MHSQRKKSRRKALMAQLAHPFVDVEGGLCGTPAIVFARPRIAKDGQGAVTLRSDHTAAVLGHCSTPYPAQIAQEFGEMLRLHFPAQHGGSHHVRDEDRQSMTFAARGDSSFTVLCAHRCCRSRVTGTGTGYHTVSYTLPGR